LLTHGHSIRMLKFQPQDPNFGSRVRESFSRQQLMQTLGATLTLVEPGVIEIELPYRVDLTQQHGFLHAGVIASVLDSACGYAAFSLMHADAEVLSVEFKINLLAPARGDRLLARAEVKRAGRTVTVCSADAFMLEGAQRKAVATMLGTMMSVRGRSDIAG
jgi:uncharacterized protein (TIGR00369 family)